MAPSIERRTGIGEDQVKKHVDLPNRTGIYTTEMLGKIRVDMSRVYTERVLVIEGESLKGKPHRKTKDGKREIDLSKEGTGAVLLGHKDWLLVSIIPNLYDVYLEAMRISELKDK